MPGVARSSKKLMSFRKTEETGRKMGEAKGKLESPQAPHRMLFSPVCTFHGPAFQA